MKVISKMESGNTTGTSGIAVEILKVSGETGIIGIVMELANSIVNEGVVPADWGGGGGGVSSILNSYKGKVTLWNEVTTGAGSCQNM